MAIWLYLMNDQPQGLKPPLKFLVLYHAITNEIGLFFLNPLLSSSSFF
jgi:hypothetical protein